MLLPDPRDAARGRLSLPTSRSTCQAPPHVLMSRTQAVGMKSCRPRSGLLTWHPSASTADSLLDSGLYGAWLTLFHPLLWLPLHFINAKGLLHGHSVVQDHQCVPPKECQEVPLQSTFSCFLAVESNLVKQQADFFTKPKLSLRMAWTNPTGSPCVAASSRTVIRHSFSTAAAIDTRTSPAHLVFFGLEWGWFPVFFSSFKAFIMQLIGFINKALSM